MLPIVANTDGMAVCGAVVATTLLGGGATKDVYGVDTD